jgi:hypothetical protein
VLDLVQRSEKTRRCCLLNKIDKLEDKVGSCCR